MNPLLACALLLLLVSAAAYSSAKPSTSVHVAPRKLASVLLSGALLVVSPFASIAENDALDGAFRAMNGKSYSSLGKSLNKAATLDFSESEKKSSTKPPSDRAQKRRAMAMCKDIFMLGKAKVSQIECNNRVNDNDYKFMLDAADKQ